MAAERGRGHIRRAVSLQGRRHPAMEEPYWERVTAYLRMAAEHGITVMLYPIDGWTIGHSFVPGRSSSAAPTVQGGSAFRICPTSSGCREATTSRPRRIWREEATSTTVSTPMMRGIRDSRGPAPVLDGDGVQRVDLVRQPVLGEAGRLELRLYLLPDVSRGSAGLRPPAPDTGPDGRVELRGREQLAGSPATTDETLRRQVLWALTSGAAGEFFGSEDWEFHAGWEERLSTPAVTQVRRLRDLFARLSWWQLVPDTDNRLVTGGRGTRLSGDDALDVLENDYVTAAKTPSGRLAVVYVPTRRVITVDRAALAAGVGAQWVDPVSGARRSVPMLAASPLRARTPAATPTGCWCCRLALSPDVAAGSRRSTSTRASARLGACDSGPPESGAHRVHAFALGRRQEDSSAGPSMSRWLARPGWIRTASSRTASRAGPPPQSRPNGTHSVREARAAEARAVMRRRSCPRGGCAGSGLSGLAGGEGCCECSPAAEDLARGGLVDGSGYRSQSAGDIPVGRGGCGFDLLACPTQHPKVAWAHRGVHQIAYRIRGPHASHKRRSSPWPGAGRSIALNRKRRRMRRSWPGPAC